MNNKKILIILALVLAAVIGGAAVLYNTLGDTVTADQLAGQATEETDAPPVQAPDFTVYDIDGNEVKLSDFIGKPTVVNFWASWCGPCQMEMPDFEEKFLELDGEVNFLMVNMTYGVYSLPTTYFIDAEGHAIAQATGAIDGDTLQRGLDMICH